MTFAKRTTVSVAKTRVEIEKLLMKHAVTRQATAQEDGKAMVLFEKDGRRVCFTMKLPRVRDFAGHRHPQRAWEQECQSMWRALLLTLKSKFVALETGIETFEQAFLAHIVLPNGERVGEWLAPQLAASYMRGAMPPLLPSGGTGDSQ